MGSVRVDISSSAAYNLISYTFGSGLCASSEIQHIFAARFARRGKWGEGVVVAFYHR